MTYLAGAAGSFDRGGGVGWPGAGQTAGRAQVAGDGVQSSAVSLLLMYSSHIVTNLH
jgi:hypothetical protein